METKKVPSWLKPVVIGSISLVGASLAFGLIIKGLAALFALGIAAVFILIAINFGPFIAEWLANAGLETRKHEWKESPVPTLQNQYMERVKSLEGKRAALTETITAVEDFRTLMRNFAQRFPANKQKIANYEIQLGKLVQVENDQKQKFENAVASVQEFSGKLEEAEAEWDVIVALRKANKNAQIDRDPMEVLKERIAFGSVETNMNKCFAELETSLLSAPKFDEIQVEGVSLQIPKKELVK